MNIITLVFLLLSNIVSSDPLEEIAAIKIGRRADGEIYIMEWYKDKYFSDTCEVYKTIMPYIQRQCFTQEAKPKKNPKKEPAVKI